MQLFFAPDLQGDHHTLEEQESKHIIRVLRMKMGESIKLTDGKGRIYTGELINEDPRRCEVRITDTIEDYGKRDYHIHIGIAPTKNINRFEWFLEKATEIGIDEITPLICQRSERKVVKTERLDKVIISALKQSVKAYHPVLHEACSFRDFIRSGSDAQKFIAYVEEGEHPSLQSQYVPGQHAVILIGPEGDFSPDEVQLAIKNGFQTVSLGKSRLRTETAGIVACHSLSLLNSE